MKIYHASVLVILSLLAGRSARESIIRRILKNSLPRFALRGRLYLDGFRRLRLIPHHPHTSST